MNSVDLTIILSLILRIQSFKIYVRATNRVYDVLVSILIFETWGLKLLEFRQTHDGHQARYSSSAIPSEALIIRGHLLHLSFRCH